jgi:hypothetical protein
LTWGSIASLALLFQLDSKAGANRLTPYFDEFLLKSGYGFLPFQRTKAAVSGQKAEHEREVEQMRVGLFPHSMGEFKERRPEACTGLRSPELESMKRRSDNPVLK